MGTCATPMGFSILPRIKLGIEGSAPDVLQPGAGFSSPPTRDGARHGAAA
jgi:hypothetical protein